jgi:hypothetical protein
MHSNRSNPRIEQLALDGKTTESSFETVYSSSSPIGDNVNRDGNNTEPVASALLDYTFTENLTVTMILWGSTLSVALIVERLGVVSALTGVIAASTLGYTLPAMIYVSTYYDDFQTSLSQLCLFDDRANITTSSSGNLNVHYDARIDTIDLNMPGDTTLSNDRSSRRDISAIILVNLSKVYLFTAEFGLSLFMFCFGVSTLLIGVTTVILDEIYNH